MRTRVVAGVPTASQFGTLRRLTSHAPFQIEPSKCGVITSNLGLVEFQLDLIRALSARESRATLSCMISADYASEEALVALREINPTASLTPAVLTDWWFRFVPTPALLGRGE